MDVTQQDAQHSNMQDLYTAATTTPDAPISMQHVTYNYDL
jgi:hypothetical protein